MVEESQLTNEQPIKLIDHYPLVIYLDYLNNKYHMLEYEHFHNKTAKWEGTVDELIEVGASTVPDTELAAQFRALFGRQEAMAAFNAGQTELTLTHPQWSDDGKVHWMETKVICIENSADSVKSISVAKCIDAQREIEEANRLLEEQVLVFNALSRNFKNVYLADLEKKTARILKLDAAYVDVPGKTDHHEFPFDAVVARWIDTIVYPDDRDKLRGVITAENVKQVLKTKDEMVGNYRSLVDGELHHFQYSLSKADDTGTKVILGFQNIDEIVDAICKAPEDKYDLVFMDIQMPKMDGYTATKEIRTLENNTKANIPIVAMTANAFEEDKKKSFEAGMNGHIAKPISIEQIAKVLDSIFVAKKA